MSIPLIAIPSGTFVMGSDNDLYGETPAHEVTLASFLIGRTPVTRAQWRAVMGTAPSELSGDDAHPVDSVSWDMAMAFCAALATHTGTAVGLPSEAQWEYACRARTTGDLYLTDAGPFADDTEIPLAVRRQLQAHAWFEENCDGTRPVGTRVPNPWGLHDMIGQVWEWCADTWHGSYHGAPSDGAAWTGGADTQPRRVLRGGAWNMNAFRCRSPYRSHDHRTQATTRFGLRIVVNDPGTLAEAAPAY